MKQYSLYIIRNLILPICVSSFTLTVIVWLTQSLRFVTLIINSGIGFFTFIKLAILIIPSLLMLILPISTFISVVYLYNKLMMDSELIVLKSAGISRVSLSRPAFLVAIMVTIISYFISLYLMPVSYRLFKDKIVFYRDNYASILLEEGVFNTNIKGLTIYIDEHQKDGTLKGILVHDDRKPSKPITMMAHTGKLIKTTEFTRFELLNGNRQEIDKEGQLAILYFDYFVYDLSLEVSKHEQRDKEPQEMFINELLGTKKDGGNNAMGKLKAEAHQRLTWPLYNIVLTIFALLVVYPPEFNRKGQSKRIIKYSMVATGLIVVYFTLNNLIASLPILTPIFYLNVVITSYIGIYMLFNKRAFRQSP